MQEKINFDNIYCMDCLEGMKAIPDGSVDMVLCDPPYGVTGLSWDTQLPIRETFKEVRRILKKGARMLFFCVQPFTSSLIQGNLIDFSHMLYWKKDRPTRHRSLGRVPMRLIEEIAVFTNSLNAGEHENIRRYMMEQLQLAGIAHRNVDVVFNNGGAHHWFRDGSDFRIPTRENYEKLQSTGYFSRPYDKIRAEFDGARRVPVYRRSQIRDVLEFPSCDKKEQVGHPTQKPVALCEYLIKTYSNEGDVILDNCMGSGTTAVAAINTGRRYIGFENNADFYNAAVKRIEEAKKAKNF